MSNVDRPLRKFVTHCGGGEPAKITHDLATDAVIVQVFDPGDGALVGVAVRVLDENTVEIFANDEGTLRVVIIG